MTWSYRALIAPLGRLAVTVAALGLVLVLMWSVPVPAWAEVPRLVLYLGLALLVMYRWAVGEMGYAPVAAAALGDVDLVRGPVFQRPDGCIALPGGYQGPARVSDVVARAD